MFHTYVLAHSGNLVDIDRASFLMDKDIFDASIRAMREARAKWPDPFDEDCARRMGSPPPKFDAAQWVWDYYCERHLEAYGESFLPDVSPDWDEGGPPPQSEHSQARK